METPKFKKFINFDDFTDESKPLIADYTCPLCKGIYYNPVIDICGHIFCEKCFEIHYENNKMCPVDHVPLDATPTKVRPLSMVLEKQTLKCKNREFGCEWNGPLKEFQQHIGTHCKRQSVMCSWIGCSQYVFREDLPIHDKCCDYRMVKCDDCELQLAFNELKDHQGTCPKFKLICPQDCGEYVEREKMDKHILNTCLNTIVPCPYLKYGCQDTVIKRDLNTFLNENRIKHEEMTMTLIDKLIDRLDDFEHQLNTVKKECSLPDKLCGLQSPFTAFIKRKREENFPLMVESKFSFNDNDERKEEAKQATLPSVFDLENLPNEISISGSKAKCFANQKKEHKYLFSTFDINYDEKRFITAWSVTILQTESWIGLGLCDKNQVIHNKMKFYSSTKSFKTGTFLISSNGYSWNCNSKEEDNKQIEGIEITEGKEMFFTYNPKEMELAYQIENIKGKLTQVYPITGNTMTPCIIFLDVGGYIELKVNMVQPQNIKINN